MNINNYEHTSSKGVDNYMQQEVTDDPLPTTIMHCTMSCVVVMIIIAIRKSIPDTEAKVCGRCGDQQAE